MPVHRRLMARLRQWCRVWYAGLSSCCTFTITAVWYAGSIVDGMMLEIARDDEIAFAVVDSGCHDKQKCDKRAVYRRFYFLALNIPRWAMSSSLAITMLECASNFHYWNYLRIFTFRSYRLIAPIIVRSDYRHNSARWQELSSNALHQLCVAELENIQFSRTHEVARQPFGNEIR